MAADTAMSADSVTIIIPNTFIFCSASCFYCIAAQITLVASWQPMIKELVVQQLLKYISSREYISKHGSATSARPE